MALSYAFIIGIYNHFIMIIRQKWWDTNKNMSYGILKYANFKLIDFGFLFIETSENTETVVDSFFV